MQLSRPAVIVINLGKKKRLVKQIRISNPSEKDEKAAEVGFWINSDNVRKKLIVPLLRLFSSK